MNKIKSLYKLIAIVGLCLVSVIIKSETSCSTVMCKYISKIDIKKNHTTTNGSSSHDDYKKDFFIIKI